MHRWINPDPAGAVTGLNLYVMMGNNPITRVDADGLQPVELPDVLKGLAKTTARKLFETGEVLNPYLKKQVMDDTHVWMRKQIRGHNLSATQFANATWDYSKKFFGAEEELAEDRISMTPEVKSGIHI
nr:RHS repeat-associated core domain-containing protein [Pseudomonas californiensis]